MSHRFSFHVGVARKYIKFWAQLQLSPIIRILLSPPSPYLRQNLLYRTDLTVSIKIGPKDNSSGAFN